MMFNEVIFEATSINLLGRRGKILEGEVLNSPHPCESFIKPCANIFAEVKVKKD